jgi:hypothetical protein
MGAGVQAEATARQLVEAQAPALCQLRIVVWKVRRGASDIDDERADTRRLVLAARGARMKGGDNENQARGDRDPRQVGRNCTWRRASLSLPRPASARAARRELQHGWPAFARGNSRGLRRGRLSDR